MSRRAWIGSAVALLVAMGILVWRSSASSAGESASARVSAAKPPIRPKAGGTLTLSPDQQTHLGVKTETLTPATYARTWTAYGVILDPVPLATLNARLASTSAALARARAEYTRVRRLHGEGQNASLKRLQAARTEYETRRAQYALLTQRLADEWGPPLVARGAARRATLIDALTRRAAAIARVAVPPGEMTPRKPVCATVVVFGHAGQPLLARSVWGAPRVNRRLQGEDFLLRFDAKGFALRPGAAVTASLQSAAPPQRGVVIPNAAVVRAAGGAWAYVQIAATHFARRAVVVREPTAGGWFVTRGFAPGDRVVVTGAGALLSKEFQSHIHVED